MLQLATLFNLIFYFTYLGGGLDSTKENDSYLMAYSAKSFFLSFFVDCLQILHSSLQYHGIFVITVMIFFVNTFRILIATVIFFFVSSFQILCCHCYITKDINKKVMVKRYQVSSCKLKSNRSRNCEPRVCVWTIFYIGYFVNRRGDRSCHHNINMSQQMNCTYLSH